nr:protein FAM71A-like [Manis javanica]
MFKSVPMFESDFIQVTKWGQTDVHRCAQIMTVGIANTNPFDPIPDVMLVAQPVRDCEKHTGCGQATEGKGHRDTKVLELTRLLPWKLVKISVHSRERQQLRVKLASGRSYYLQLWAPPDKQEDLFACWEEVIDLLRPLVEAYSSTHAVPARDLFISVFEEMDRRSPEAAHFQGRPYLRRVPATLESRLAPRLLSPARVTYTAAISRTPAWNSGDHPWLERPLSATRSTPAPDTN